MPPPAAWKETYRVRSYETDPTGRASTAAVCNYLQEAAANHAYSLRLSVEHFRERPLTWMLGRLRVLVETYPRWRDEVTVETWPSGVDRLLATRDFLIFDGDGRTIGRATTGWMLIDLERRRPVRMPEAVTALALLDRNRAAEDASATLPAPAAGAAEHHVRVEYNDLDVNKHVNNVRYIEWALEGLTAERRDAHDLAELDVHFRAEAVYGDVVAVRAGPVDGSGEDRSVDTNVTTETEGISVFAHVITETDGKELARIRTGWRPR